MLAHQFELLARRWAVGWKWRRVAASATAGRRAHSLFEGEVWSAAEEAWDEWICIGDDIVIGAIGELRRYARATVAFVEISAVFHKLVILNERPRGRRWRGETSGHVRQPFDDRQPVRVVGQQVLD